VCVLSLLGYAVSASAQSSVCNNANIVTNGDFEQGWTNPWRVVQAGNSFPGWTVTHGNIDYGNYVTGGHCTGGGASCAASGDSFIDLCGSTRGGIQQSLSTSPNQVYNLSLRFASHPGCQRHASTTEAVVQIDGQPIQYLFYDTDRSNGWNSLFWDSWDGTFVASDTTTRLTINSLNFGCGCIVVDDVRVCQGNNVVPGPTLASLSTAVASSTAAINNRVTAVSNALVQVNSTMTVAGSTIAGISNAVIAVTSVQAGVLQTAAAMQSDLSSQSGLVASVSQGLAQAGLATQSLATQISRIRQAVQGVTGFTVGQSGQACSGAQCTSIVSDLSNNVVVNALSGTVRMATRDCGDIDMCTATQAISAAVSAIQQIGQI